MPKTPNIQANQTTDKQDKLDKPDKLDKLVKPPEHRKVVSVRLSESTIEKIEQQMRDSGIEVVAYEDRKGQSGGLARWIKDTVAEKLEETEDVGRE